MEAATSSAPTVFFSPASPHRLSAKPPIEGHVLRFKIGLAVDVAMMFGRIYLVVVAFLFGFCRAKSLLDYADEIPACGLSCILQAVPESACQTVTNSTCICQDTSLFSAVNECMAAKCTVMERIQVAQIDEEACDKAKRHQTGDIPPFLVLDSVSLICLLVRLVARYMMAGKMEMDDWVVFVLSFFFVTFMVLGNYVRITAIGYDVWDLDVSTIKTALKIFFIDELFYTIVLALCRVSLLFFLIRVFSVPTFQKICWIVIGWVVLSAIIIILMTLFQCWPINYNWEGVFGDFGAHKCLDVNALAYAAAGMGIAQDLTILLLPLPIIAQLNMSFKKRLQTLFMFSLGIFVVLASCLRLRYLTQFAKSLNPTWDYTNPVIWTSLEVKVTVIVLSLPTIRVLLANLIPSVFGTSQKSTPTKKFTPHSGSRSTGRNQYEDLPDGIATFEPARQLWEDDIELRDDIESSSIARLRKDDAQIGVVTYTLPKPEERSWS
ncbi:hypothetical protein AB5N19_03854 [Seiridium cardinale]